MNIDLTRPTTDSIDTKIEQNKFDPDKRNTPETISSLENNKGSYDPDKRIVSEPEKTVRYDDNGDVYISDGKLIQNNTYTLNECRYETDDHGRIVLCEDKPQITPENGRDLNAQKDVGGNDRKENDQGGHIVARDMNGDPGQGNIVAMDQRINQSDYKRMENYVKTSLDDGKAVSRITDLSYSNDSERPDRINTSVVVDGKETKYSFDNNMDGSLLNEVPENGKEDIQIIVDEEGGIVSSIKEEYNENGDLENTIVLITYIGEDGENCRVRITIPAE